MKTCTPSLISAKLTMEDHAAVASVTLSFMQSLTEDGGGGQVDDGDARVRSG